MRTLELGRQEVFVSPFELNVENDRLEVPPHPVILFSVPVYDANGLKRGVLSFSYEGRTILNEISEKKAKSAESIGQLVLLNSDGYWLQGPNPKDDWAFMHEETVDKTLAKSAPELWKNLSARQSGSPVRERRLLCVRHHLPAGGCGPDRL